MSKVECYRSAGSKEIQSSDSSKGKLLYMFRIILQVNCSGSSGRSQLSWNRASISAAVQGGEELIQAWGWVCGGGVLPLLP